MNPILNEEYSFWSRDVEYPVDSIYASNKEEYIEDSIGSLNGTRQDISNVESENVSSNLNDEEDYNAPISNEEVVPNHIIQKKELQIICINVDDNIGNLKRYRFTDDNNNFNYGDVDKEMLQFEYQGSIGESETIVFRYCDDILNYTLQEEGSTKLE